MEIFQSIQGEGTLIGTPAIFIRFAGCNLQCPWCDTFYASHPIQEHIKRMSTKELLRKSLSKKITKGISPKLVVLTGGEPLIQNEELLIELCNKFRIAQRTILVETNGTKFLPELIPLVDYWSISPKIYRMTNLEEESSRIITEYILSLNKESPNIYFKFVIEGLEDLSVVKMFFAKYTKAELERIPIIFQPNTSKMGGVEEYINANRILVENVLKDKNWNGTNVRIIPQFHQLLWWNQRGV